MKQPFYTRSIFAGRQGTRWTLPQKILLLCFATLLLFLALGCALTPIPVLPFIVVALSGLGVLALCYPLIAALLVVVCASVPSYTLPLPGYHLHLVEPAILLCILVAVLRCTRGSFSSLHLIAAAFWGIAVISFIHVPEFSSSSSPYGADKSLLTLCFVFAALFCGTFLARTIRAVSTFLTLTLLFSLLPYAIALSQALNMALFPMLEVVGSRSVQLTQGRLWGPFPWSVNFAMYLVNLFALALACWLLGEKRWHRVVGALMTIVTALTLFGTGTKSASLAALFILLLALCITRRFRILLLLSIASLLCCFLSAGTLFHVFLHDDTSTNNRLLIWHEAIILILAHPWLGIGLQQFHYYYQQLIVSKDNQLGPQGIHPHEQYLEWAMESGVLWLVIGVVLLSNGIFCCLRAYRCANNKTQYYLRPLFLAVPLALIANAIIGFFDAPLDQLEAPLLLFFLLGIATGYAASMPPAPRLEQKTYLSLLSRAMTFRFSLPNFSYWGQSQRSIRKAPDLFVCDGESISRMSAVASQELPIAQSAADAREHMRKTGRSIVLQTLSWAVALPLIFPMTALLTRYLGPMRYGEYSLTFPFFTIFALLSGTGMDVLLVRQLSIQPRFTWGTTLGGAIATRAMSTGTSIMIALVIACLLPISVEQRALFLVGSISLLFSFSFNGVRIVYTHGFRAEQRIGLLCLIEALNRLLSAALVAVVVLLHLSLLWAYILLVYSDLPAFCWLVVVAQRSFRIRIHMRQRYIRDYLLESLPLIGHNAFSLLVGQVDLLLLMLLAGPFATGLYALASRVIDPLISIVLAYTNGFYPLFCRTYAQNAHAFALSYYHATRLLTLLIVPVAAVIILAAPVIVHLLAGSQFASATPIVQLLMGAMALTFCSQVAEKAAVAAHLEKRLLPVTSLALFTNIVLNFLLIPHWSILGAALASLVTEALTLSFYLFLLRFSLRVIPVSALMRMVAFVLASALTLLLFSSWSISLYSRLPLLLALIVVYALLTRTFTGSDLHDLRSLLRGGKISHAYSF